MLHELKRWIFFYDCKLKTNPENAPNIPMDDIIKQLKTRFEAGGCVKIIENESAAIRINDMEIDESNNIVFLLIQYSDKKVSDPAFAHLKTGELRVEPKLDGEGIAVSAHMAMSLVPTEPGGNIYLTLLEEVTGVTRTRIEPFLTSEFKEGCSFSFKEGNSQEKKCRAIVEFIGHPSLSLKEDLERGELKNIELVHNKLDESQFDELGFTKEVSKRIILKTSRAYQGDEALNVIEQIRLKAKKKGFSELRVKYKRFEGKQRTIPIETEKGIYDLCFTRIEKVDFKEILPQCLKNIREDMSEHMRRFILSERKKA